MPADEEDGPRPGFRQVVVERAGPADAQGLVRLRSLMFEDMGIDPGGPDAPWRSAAVQWFRAGLDDAEHMAAFVVRDADAGVVSSAVGQLQPGPPRPASTSGWGGHVFNMSTEPAFRRRGYARACLEALLGWFATATPARSIVLNATAEGEPLYRAIGFAPPRWAALQLTLPPLPTP
jgi:ribosomal protein S18 acetylase RimI-like enzyme